MSLGNILTGIGYGIMGMMLIGAGPFGFAIGFGIGFGISLAMDGLAPDTPTPGSPQTSKLSIPTADEGLSIPDILGTTKLSGNIIQYFGSRSVAIIEEIDTGAKGAPDAETQTTGYKYFLSWAMGICLGPADYLYAVYDGDTLIYDGQLQRPTAGSFEIVSLGPSDVVYDLRDGAASSYTRPLGDYLISEGPSGINYQYTFYFGGGGGSFNYLLRASMTNISAFIFMHYTNPATGAVTVSPGKFMQGYSVDTINLYETWVVSTSFDGFMGYSASMTVAQKNNYHLSVILEYGEDYAIASPGPAVGNMYFYFGTQTQTPNSKMKAAVSDTPGYRGLCYAFFDDVYIGPYNRAPNIKFIIGKFPQLTFNANHLIGQLDYNPAHALWYVMTDRLMAGLPEGFMDSISFSAGANTLYTEGKGVSILFDRQQTAGAYAKTILEHANAIMRYSSSGDLADE